MKLKKRTHYGYSSAYSGAYGGAYDGNAVGWTPADLGLLAWYDAELGQPKGVGYVQLSGTSGDYIFTPDAPNLDIAGDLEVVMRVYCNDWSTGVNQTLVGKYVTTGNQRSFRFYVSTTGSVVLTASADGTAVTSASMVPSVALPDATWIWLRMRLQLSNGANSVATLETAADNGSNGAEPTVWTANGTQTAAVIASVFSSTSPVEIGTFNNGTSERFGGRIGRCIVRDGFAGRTLADFNADQCYGPGYLNEGSLPTSGGSAYVPLRGVSGDYIWTADKAALRITGDIEMVARVALNDWTPAAEATLIAREQTVSTRSYRMSVLTDGRVNFTMTSDGSTLTNIASSTSAPWVDGTTYWVRATRRQSDGRVQFFYAADQATEPGSWTQIGTDQTLAAGSAVFAGTSQLEVGSRLAGVTQPLAGKVFRAIVRNGIDGTTVADFNAANATAFGLPSDGVGNGWLIADPKHHGNWTLGLPKIYDRSGNGVAPTTFGSGSNQPTWLPWKGYAGVYNPGQAGNFVSCPTSAALDITGDVDLRATVWLASLTAAQNQTLVGTMRNGDLTGFMFHVSATGFLQTFHGNGAAVLTTTCPASLASAGLIPGREYELRATIDVNDGAGNYAVSFYARRPGDPWVLLGVTTVPGTTAIAASGRACYVSQQDNFSARILTGAVLAASVRNGIDGSTVADFVAASCGQSGYTDTLGNVWTVTRATSGRKAVVQSPVAASARSVILHGTDDYIDVPAAAIPPSTAASDLTYAISERQWNTPNSFGRIFATQANSTSSTAGYYLMNSSATNLLWRAADGVTLNGGPGGSNFRSGVREVFSCSVSGAGQTMTVDQSGTTSAAALGAVGDRTATPGRIGAVLNGTSLQDLEFEALLTKAAATSDIERGLITAYYRGGL